jgi:hypothetical protein
MTGVYGVALRLARGPTKQKQGRRRSPALDPTNRKSYFAGAFGVWVDAAVPCLVDFLVLFFCLATFGFAVEAELDWVLLEAGGVCEAGELAGADCAKTAAAVNMVVRINRFILSLSLAGAFDHPTLPIMRPLRKMHDNPARRAFLPPCGYCCRAFLNE